MCGQVPGSMRKGVMMSLIVGIRPLCSPAVEHLWVFTGACMGHQNIDLKQRDCRIFLQQTYVYSGSAENCKYQQAMCRTMKGGLFSREEKETGRAGVNKQNMDFIDWVLAGKEEGSFFLLGFAIVVGYENFPFWSPGWVYLIEVSVYLFFFLHLEGMTSVFWGWKCSNWITNTHPLCIILYYYYIYIMWYTLILSGNIIIITIFLRYLNHLILCERTEKC